MGTFGMTSVERCIMVSFPLPCLAGYSVLAAQPPKHSGTAGRARCRPAIRHRGEEEERKRSREGSLHAFKPLMHLWEWQLLFSHTSSLGCYLFQLEFIDGPDLLTLLNHHKGRFDEPMACFFFMQ